MAELQGYFNAVDVNHQGFVTPRELTALKWMGGRTFSLKTCEVITKVFDNDGDGRLSFQEYVMLHKFVVSMEASFTSFDRDRSGKLETNELQSALEQTGFRFSLNTVQQVCRKFGHHDWSSAVSFDFESYVDLCAFLGQVRSLFERSDPRGTGNITVNLEQLVSLASGF